MQDLFALPNIFSGFRRNIEKDFFLQAIGYNNFMYIKPMTHSRVQVMYTLHLVLSGRGTLNIAGRRYNLKSPCLFFLPPKTSISYYPDNDDPWQYVWFEMLGGISEEYARLMGMSYEIPTVHCKDYKASYYSIYGLFKQLELGGTVGYYEALSAFYRLLDANTQDAPKTEKSLSDSIISYLLYQYQNPNLSVENICRDFRISHSYLCKIFRRETGRPLIQHLIEIRIEKACELLRTTDLNIKETAYSAGFGDELYFMKTFKKHMHATPMEYRKKCRTS
ncbi:MAG: helix-turn-helix domain-containing protein [Firmicutes bacterium]|nr:helix-turn-helix domain-containing protein [Bacillota bacterium]